MKEDGLPLYEVVFGICVFTRFLFFTYEYLSLQEA